MNSGSFRVNTKLPFLTLLFLSLLISSCQSDNLDPDPIEEDQIEDPQIAPEDKLPHVFVNTNGRTIVDEPKIDGEIRITEEEVETYSGRIGIEIRGASSQMFPKKSYGMETRDEVNEDLDVALLGLPEEEDWILYAPYSDKSLMRNILIYDLSRDMNRYASRSLFVELTINDVYKGVYVFMEKLKRDAERIAINKLNDDENTGEDLTGGYILKIDKLAGTNLGDGYNDLNSFTSAYAPPSASIGQEIHFLYEEPDAEDITTEQKTYISTYVNTFETALASDEFADLVLGYPAYIDIESFIDFFILTEISNNVDGYRLSTFMTKDKNGKFEMGPIWDFNLAFGNADYCSGGETNVWAYKFNERCSEDFWLIPFWWERLLEDPAFVGPLKARYQALRAGELSDAQIMSRINTYDEKLTSSGSVYTNFTTWNVLGIYVWPNRFVGTSHDEEVTYLRDWISDRLLWLDSAIEGLPN
ncbi:MAG: CotH kinase family protein [Flavobacteriaceae bacterium]|nr:CotH kinase family protein [Flavobacteriaceae bacterium]